MKTVTKSVTVFITELLLIAFILSYALNLIFDKTLFYVLTISFGVVLYQFAIRIFVNWFINNTTKRPWSYTNRWFRERNFERPLYKLFLVHRWKNHLPKDIKKDEKRLGKVISNSCMVEVSHEIVILASFLPVLLPLLLENFTACHGLLIFSCIVSAIIDLLFVMKERYTRPKLVRLYHKQISGRKKFYSTL